MVDWALPMHGGCRCGKVRFRIDAAPMLTMVCHCTGCQRMTASAYSTTVMVPSDGFAVTEGEPVIGGIHGAPGQHNHCDCCMSWLFTRIPREYGAIVNVRATMLDDVSWFAPFVENYTSEMLTWAKVAAAHSYAQFPPKEEYQGLLAEFAERNAN